MCKVTAEKTRRPAFVPDLKNTFLNFDVDNQSDPVSCGSSSCSRRRVISQPPSHDRISYASSEVTAEMDESGDESWPSTPDSSPRGQKYEVPEVQKVHEFKAFRTIDCVTKLINMLAKGDIDGLCRLASKQLREDVIFVVTTPAWREVLVGTHETCDFLRRLHNAFPDLSMALDEIIHPQDPTQEVDVGYKATCSGTQRFSFLPGLQVGKHVKFLLEAATKKDLDGRTSWYHWNFRIDNETVAPMSQIGYRQQQQPQQQRQQQQERQQCAMPSAEKITLDGMLVDGETVLPATGMMMPMIMPVVPVLQSMISNPHDQMQFAATSLLVQAEQARRAAASMRMEGQRESAICTQATSPCVESKTRLLPKKKKVSASKNNSEEPSTVILQNIPLEYSRKMLVSMLDQHGFAGKYDFVYLPRDFQRSLGLGYAFVNLTSHEDASRAVEHFQGFCSWDIPSQKVCEAGWTSGHQGVVEQIRRYRNSPVMHESVPDEYKPALFKGGVRISFPLPTQKLKKPRGIVQGTRS